jgi:hypothetical protein
VVAAITDELSAEDVTTADDVERLIALEVSACDISSPTAPSA